MSIHSIGEELELHDSRDQFQQAYGVRAGDHVLVRPDGYIGMIETSAREDELENYLTNVGLAKSLT